MNTLQIIEDHFGMKLPRAYRIWHDEGAFDSADSTKYLWVNEAEWIPPVDVPTWQLPTYGKHVDGLVPFAFSGAGDPWCWQTNTQTAPDEYEIWFCLHDEDRAVVYSPTFTGWFYRNCLEYVASVGDDPDGIDEAREYLNDGAQRLVVAGATDLADHLSQVAKRKPIRYHDPHDTPTLEHHGLNTFEETREIVVRQFGIRYVHHDIDWQTSNSLSAVATDDAAELAARESLATERRVGQYKKATADADEAFRSGDFAVYAELLERFEDLLTPVQKKKRELASRKAQN
jgi:hypothetical protein